MALVDINWYPTRSELRIFSLLLIGFGVIVALLMHLQMESPTLALGVLVVTGAIGLTGLVVPVWVRPIYVIWMALAFPIGWTVSHVMMLAVFFVVLTPIGLTMRLCGRDAMQRRFDRAAKTYWRPRLRHNDLKRYFKQF